jgi:hypothetical protein
MTDSNEQGRFTAGKLKGAVIEVSEIPRSFKSRQDRSSRITRETGPMAPRVRTLSRPPRTRK